MMSNASSASPPWRSIRTSAVTDSGAGHNLFAPRVRLEVRAEAIVIRLEAHNAPKRSRADEFANGLKIAIVAAILIHGEKSPGLLGEVHEINRFGVGRCERFVDHDI